MNCMEMDDRIVLTSYDQMKAEFIRILLKFGSSELNAEKCAEIFAMISPGPLNTSFGNR